ncbi:MAG: transposase [Muribaculum sp.]|nr:transposase [Muribaculum sp.]
MCKSPDKWSDRQKKRSEILFKEYPKLKDAYWIANKLRAVFRSDIYKDTARTKFQEWYDEVAKCTSRELKSARDTIKFREDEVLNYFINRSTNASAESLNSKLKGFRSQLRGVADLPFYMYRCSA